MIIISHNFLSAQNTYEFLRIDVSSKVSALGGSFTANSDDPDVIFKNPAGIYSLTDMPTSLNFANYLLDINLTSISTSKFIEGVGRFGAGIKYINYGNFTEADQFGNKLSEFGAGEVAFVLGYSNSLDENFYYGTAAKFIYSGIANYSSTAFAFDFGLHYFIPDEDISIGLAIQNIGGQLSKFSDTKENLPFDITLGFSNKFEHLPLRLYLDFHRLNNEEIAFTERFQQFTIGGEFTLSKALKLRVGYDNEKRRELKIGGFSGLAGLNIGLGITIKDYLFNYAYSSFGQVGAIHRLGLTTTFQ
ncbi:MAG: hypothetical protein C0425_05470 [Chlorobiaceae bacterium]|nr:hypothetical protein [Chlorobiaceae bacterium]MBA4309767.1 hypothetical protein [Chlorobiaceae bacterium]